MVLFSAVLTVLEWVFLAETGWWGEGRGRSTHLTGLSHSLWGPPDSFSASAFGHQWLTLPPKPFPARKSARHLFVTGLTNFSSRPTLGSRPPQCFSASPARHLPHNLGVYRVYCLNQDTFESAKMLNQMVLQDNRHKLGSMVNLPMTIIQCDKCNNKSLNTFQWKRCECNAPKGQNLFPIKNISKLFSNWHPW